MANIRRNNRHNLRLRVNEDEYWDFCINKDSFGEYVFSGNSLNKECLASYIDMGSSDSVDGDILYGLPEYSWEGAYAVKHSLRNIGYTGVDNGLYRFRKDRISNKDFVDIFTKQKYDIEEGDTRLKLHAVSGNSFLHEYPLHVEDGYVRFNGGFYQGFFMTECGKYAVLPNKLGNEETWEFEFTLKRCDMEKESDKTLNDKYPNNKGIFFYIGTRAENKWIYLYDENDKEGRENCFTLAYDDYIEDAAIDKKTYIIGNFFNVNPDFEETPPLDIDNYLNFNYYDEKLYTVSEEELIEGFQSCDGMSLMDDYVDMGVKPVLIDENAPHITMDSWCCGVEEVTEKKNGLVPFYNACGCLRYKPSKRTIDTVSDKELHGCDLFGDEGYIDDFDGLDYDVDYIEDELDISAFMYETDNGLKVNSANDYYFYTDNKFLLFDRTKDGYTVKNWQEGVQMMYFGKKNKFKGNLFILMNRTPTGYTINTIDALREAENASYDSLYKDIWNNAFALRITDDGEIGYRYLIHDCNADNEGKYSVIEGYSFPNVISDCEWHTVHVSMRGMFKGMKLYFYVDGKLVYVTKTIPKINMHALDDLYEKQEGVPYNISIGGGTQGLAETVMLNYMLEPTRVYPIEENFAGSFIGYMKSFRFYTCEMDQPKIESNYRFDSQKSTEENI